MNRYRSTGSSELRRAVCPGTASGTGDTRDHHDDTTADRLRRAALALGLTACGGAATPPAATAPASSAAAAGPTDADDDSATAEGGETAAAGATVSANTASEDEIAQALTTAGVSNADRWAEEVVEYRPYPTDDPNLTKLRENLAKYNPGAETTDKIVSALTP